MSDSAKIKKHSDSGLFVSEDGRVFKELNFHLSGGSKTRRYKAIQHATKRYDIHRLVAETYIENPEGKPWVLHRDDSSTNNCVDNLYWGTPKENQADRRSNYGSRDSAIEMWKSGMNYPEIAKVAGVSVSRVSQIVASHLEEKN